jgi:hypothetical protein
MSNAGYVTNTDKTPQVVAPKTWTRLVFDGIDRFSVAEGPSVLNAQLYASLPASGRPKVIGVRFQRFLPDGSTDPTAQAVRACPSRATWSDTFCDVNFCEGDTPMGVELYHDGTASITLTTRIFKVINGSEYAARRLLPAT